MPTVVTEGQYRFVIRTHEKEFEPPHVHIGGGDDECRIRLNDGTYMNDPPPGQFNDPPPGQFRDILDVYEQHAEEIRATWDRVHQR